MHFLERDFPISLFVESKCWYGIEDSDLLPLVSFMVNHKEFVSTLMDDLYFIFNFCLKDLLFYNLFVWHHITCYGKVNRPYTERGYGCPTGPRTSHVLAHGRHMFLWAPRALLFVPSVFRSISVETPSKCPFPTEITNLPLPLASAPNKFRRCPNHSI